jgi:hypothetical protein
VFIGASKQLFLVHTEVICAKSKFFKAACNKRWFCGKERKVTLPDVEPQVFQHYVTWVYSGRVDISSSITKDDPKASKEERQRIVAMHLELYLLGDVLDDVLLRNKAIRLPVMDASILPRANTVRRVWEKTPENSPVRRLLVDRAIIRTRREFLTGNLIHYPAGFVLQVAVSLLQEVPSKGKLLLEAKLPSYLEPVEEADYSCRPSSRQQTKRQLDGRPGIIENANRCLVSGAKF